MSTWRIAQRIWLLCTLGWALISYLVPSLWSAAVVLGCLIMTLWTDRIATEEEENDRGD